MSRSVCRRRCSSAESSARRCSRSSPARCRRSARRGFLPVRRWAIDDASSVVALGGRARVCARARVVLAFGGRLRCPGLRYPIRVRSRRPRDDRVGRDLRRWSPEPAARRVAAGVVPRRRSRNLDGAHQRVATIGHRRTGARSAGPARDRATRQPLSRSGSAISSSRRVSTPRRSKRSWAPWRNGSPPRVPGCCSGNLSRSLPSAAAYDDAITQVAHGPSAAGATLVDVAAALSASPGIGPSSDVDISMSEQDRRTHSVLRSRRRDWPWSDEQIA